jgi:methylase of polypeptide subunit release factors
MTISAPVLISAPHVTQVTMLLSMLGNEHEAYWGRRYGKELTAVRASLAMGASDPMESLFVWFGKMAMLMACQLIQSEELGLKTDTSVVLDLGCGNGFVCEVLHAMGFKHVIGVDYSPQAIRLALVRITSDAVLYHCHAEATDLDSSFADGTRALPLAGAARVQYAMGHHIPPR